MLLNVFFIAFTASTFIAVASAAYGNFIESAVAAEIIVFAFFYVASYIVIEVLHKNPPFVFCAERSKIFKAIDKPCI